MKDITKFIFESHLNYDDVFYALLSYLSFDDFTLDPVSHKEGSGLQALKHTRSIIDILDYHDGWDEIADECDIDIDTLADFIEKNEKKLIKELKKEL